MGDGFAQFGQALGGKLPLGVPLATAQGVVHATAPLIVGKLRLARGSADEVIARRRVQRPLGQYRGALAPAFERVGGGQRDVLAVALAQGVAWADEGAAANHAAKQVVVGQA
ncbi:hypothetical protein WR25_14048 [Diploscapter pachys]|uniref:Uncharacterized protein n=1 Tax=Diploscapter pachys TaxID=2018661 RepID=A0A2A2M6H7_9BILA|nr:hypothetical protein WR25_14048 [Diploscapter pachys]